MASYKAAQTEVLRGYRLIEPLAPQGPGERWKCNSPGGRHKLARFLVGTQRDLKALRMLVAVQHPSLVGLDRIELLGSELLLLSDFAERTLNDVLIEYRLEGRPGLPRAEALAYLRDVSEALDYAAQKYGLQHLGITPRTIAVMQQRARVLDLGLAHCLARRPGGAAEARQLGAFAPPYAAPELALGNINLACDLYSLGITYYELLTGETPTGDAPDLSRLPESDRALVGRAIAHEADERMPSCLDFVHALLRNDRPNGYVTPTAAPPVSPSSAAIRRRRGERDCGSSASRPRLTPIGARRSRVLPRPPAAAPAAPPPDETTLPGYRLLTCSEHSPLGEIWKAETVAGERRHVRLLFGVDPQEQQAGGKPIDRLRALQHPGLAAAELVEWPNRLAIISDAGRFSLAGRYRRSQAAGLTGIPREELLDYLRQLAATIDHVTANHQLQHLSLTPQQVFVNDGKVRAVGHGLAELFWLPAGQQALALAPRYAAPELLQGKVSRAADQYSLAVVFAELLVGHHPFRHLGNAELLAAQRPRADLTMLPAADRAAIQRALHSDPERRFVCCSDFVTALGGVAPAHLPSPSAAATPALPPGASRLIPGRMTPAQVIGELVLAAAGTMELREYRNTRYVYRPGVSIEHHCFARLLPGTAWLKMEGFRQQWHAQATAMDNDRFQLIVPYQANLWDRMLGRQLGLDVTVELHRPQHPTGILTEIAVRIRPLDPTNDRSARLLEEVGPVVLDSVRNFLQAHRERRSQERLPFDTAAQVCPVFPNLQRGEPIESKTRDISLHGIGLIVPHHPKTVQVAVRLAPQPGGELISVPGRIVRAIPERDGQYEIGVCFATQPAALKDGKKIART